MEAIRTSLAPSSAYHAIPILARLKAQHGGLSFALANVAFTLPAGYRFTWAQGEKPKAITK